MTEPNPHAKALGALGGKARAAKLSKERMAEIARLGGKARQAPSVLKRTKKQGQAQGKPKSF